MPRRKKLAASVIAADRATIRAIAQLVGYQSANPACTVEAMLALDATLHAAEQNTAGARDDNQRTTIVFEKADEVEIDTGYMLHEIACTARAQVIGLFGRDSFEVKSIGLTRASERKQPRRSGKGGE